MDTNELTPLPRANGPSIKQTAPAARTGIRSVCIKVRDPLMVIFILQSITGRQGVAYRHIIGLGPIAGLPE